jgi:hypothetical protein
LLERHRSDTNYNLPHQMSLSKSKFWYSSNCLHFFKAFLCNSIYFCMLLFWMGYSVKRYHSNLSGACDIKLFTRVKYINVSLVDTSTVLSKMLWHLRVLHSIGKLQALQVWVSASNKHISLFRHFIIYKFKKIHDTSPLRVIIWYQWYKTFLLVTSGVAK